MPENCGKKCHITLVPENILWLVSLFCMTNEPKPKYGDFTITRAEKSRKSLIKNFDTFALTNQLIIEQAANVYTHPASASDWSTITYYPDLDLLSFLMSKSNQPPAFTAVRICNLASRSSTDHTVEGFYPHLLFSTCQSSSIDH